MCDTTALQHNTIYPPSNHTLTFPTDNASSQYLLKLASSYTHTIFRMSTHGVEKAPTVSEANLILPSLECNKLAPSAMERALGTDGLLLQIMIACLGSETVRLVHLDEVSTRYWDRHLQDCHLAKIEDKGWEGDHSRFHPRGRLDPTTNEVTPTGGTPDSFCLDPKSKITTKIQVPPSVLQLRLVSKAWDRSVTKAFWASLRFAFRRPAEMQTTLQRIKHTLPTLPLSSITKIQLAYEGRDNVAWDEVAALLPDLSSIALIAVWNQPYQVVDSLPQPRPAGEYPYTVALDKLHQLAVAFRNNCPKLRDVQIVGQDRIQVWNDTHTNEYWANLDANDPDAFGPTLRHNMLPVSGNAGGMTHTDVNAITQSSRKNGKRATSSKRRTAAASLNTQNVAKKSKK